jgi:glycosyltransferase involved in cell wall biosynthesis
VKVLLIGAFPPPYGGTTISLELLRRSLEGRGYMINSIDCSVRSSGRLRTFMSSLLACFRLASSSSPVVLNFSDQAAVLAGPFFYLAARIRGARVIYRQFGGEFDSTYFGLNAPMKWLVRNSILRSDLVFLQTRRQLERLAPECKTPPVWLPTSRMRDGVDYQGKYSKSGSANLSCVFIGQVSVAKGALIAAKAVSSVSGAGLTIFGELLDVTRDEIEALGARYLGELRPDCVQQVMCEFDLLVFPTTYRGEGYPGVLVEAAHVGLPVVVSRWQSIPEMFSEEEAIFISPGSEHELVGVLRRIRDRDIDLGVFSRRIRARSTDYDAETVLDRVADACSPATESGIPRI